jgi:hypothetical protein
MMIRKTIVSIAWRSSHPAALARQRTRLLIELLEDRTVLSPIVTAPADQFANEGTSQLFALGSFTDPGASGPWNVDVNWGDGTADTTFTASTTGTLTAQAHGYDDDGDYTVTVMVTDPSEQSGSAAFTAHVANVAPTAGLAGPADGFQGVSGQERTFTLSATDPSAADQAAGFTYEVTWGDGSATETYTGLTGIPASHVYATPGNYTASVTATDQDGATGPAATLSVPIRRAELQGTNLAVGGTTGNDHFNFTPGAGAGNLAVTVNGVRQGTFAVTGSVTIFGEAGTNTVTINGTTSADTFTIDPADVVMDGTTFDGNSIQAWRLNGRGGNDTFIVDPGGVATIDGGTGNSTLAGSNTTNNWSITGANAGRLGSTTFTHIANLTGGSGVDTFKISTEGSLSGNLDGGGAPANLGDWLDYSLSAASITVNLGTGAATGIGGTVANIQNVVGGSGGDNLTGDGQGNILIGGAGNDVISAGSGRSLLIGGLGNDTITGGTDDDILIGGYTSYDRTHNETALMSILAEWQSGDSYNTRIADLKNGGGLNGTNVLVLGSTVKDGGGSSTLRGDPAGSAGDLDWFFQGIHDSIADQESLEQINDPYAVRGMYGRDASATGFDTLAGLGFTYIDSTPDDDFNALAARGLKGFVWLGGYDNATGQFNESDAQVTADVSALAGNPGVGAYFIADEPDAVLNPGAPAQIKARSDLIHSLDPGKPTFIVSYQVAQLRLFAGKVDVIGLDHYPISYTQGANYSILDQEIAQANQLHIHYWGVIQAFGDDPNSPNSYYRLPTPAELDQEFTIWRASKMEGYLVFGWHWPATAPDLWVGNHPELQAQLAIENNKGPVSTATLVPIHSTWKYLDNGSDQGTAWQSSNFDDSSWAAAAGPLGYGTGNLHTVIGYGPDDDNKYITTYFRLSFNVADPSRFSGLMLRLLQADGAVVYLNGTEVYRGNLPTGTINATTLASSWVADSDESRYFPATISPAALVQGTNVLAVEVHLWSASGPDMLFDLGLLGFTTAI